MAVMNLKGAKAHTIYRNAAGKRLPGVTTITGTLAKHLEGWVANLVKQGYDYREYMRTVANIGTCAHEMCVAELEQRSPDLSPFTKEEMQHAEVSYLKFLEFVGGHKIEVLACEVPMISEHMQVGGTMDILWKCDGVVEVADLKTSDSGLYLENGIQLSAYYHIALENGYEPERARLLRIGKSESEGPETIVIDNDHIVELYVFFARLRENYEAARVLKKAVGLK